LVWLVVVIEREELRGFGHFVAFVMPDWTLCIATDSTPKEKSDYLVNVKRIDDLLETASQQFLNYLGTPYGVQCGHCGLEFGGDWMRGGARARLCFC
jgi:hypothetical protein